MTNKKYYKVSDILKETHRALSSIYELINQSKPKWEKDEPAELPKPTIINNVIHWDEESKDKVLERLKKPIGFTSETPYMKMKKEIKKLKEDKKRLIQINKSMETEIRMLRSERNE